jgi:hypothetical protein
MEKNSDNILDIADLLLLAEMQQIGEDAPLVQQIFRSLAEEYGIRGAFNLSNALYDSLSKGDPVDWSSLDLKTQGEVLAKLQKAELERKESFSEAGRKFLVLMEKVLGLLLKSII